MSLSNTNVNRQPDSPALNDHGAAEPSSSTSSSSLSASSSSTPKASRLFPVPNESKGQAYLDVPAFHRPSRPSRPSIDSSFSELSELSIHLNELQSTRPLIRSFSQDDAPQPRSLWARLLAGLHKFYVINYGAMLVLIAQMFGTGMNISTGLLEQDGTHGKAMHPFQILFVRQAITAVLLPLYCMYSKSIPDFPFGPRGVRWLLVSRGFFGFFGVFGMYFSLLYLPLSEATVLTFLAPILTCYLCSFVIPGEFFGRQQQLAGLVSLSGVLFIAQPASLFSSSTSSQTSSPPATPPSNSTMTTGPPQTPTADQHLAAIGIAMLGVVGSTGALTSIRAIGTRCHAFISINYFSTWSTIVSLVFIIALPDVKFRLPSNVIEWSLLGMLGVCGFVTQFLLTAGLSYGGPAKTAPDETEADRQTRPKIRDIESHNAIALENLNEQAASIEIRQTPDDRHDSSEPPKSKHVRISGTRATSMVYTQMLFALAGDKLVFGATPDTMSWIGSVLIVAGAVWVASARTTAANVEDTGGTERVESLTRDATQMRQSRGKNDETTEEVIALMDDHEGDDDDDGLDERKHRHVIGIGTNEYNERDDNMRREVQGLAEELETRHLQPTIGGS